MAKSIKELTAFSDGLSAANPADDEAIARILFEAVTNKADGDGIYARKMMLAEIEAWVGRKRDDVSGVIEQLVKEYTDNEMNRAVKVEEDLADALVKEAELREEKDGDFTTLPAALTADNLIAALIKEYEERLEAERLQKEANDQFTDDFKKHLVKFEELHTEYHTFEERVEKLEGNDQLNTVAKTLTGAVNELDEKSQVDGAGGLVRGQNGLALSKATWDDIDSRATKTELETVKTDLETGITNVKNDLETSIADKADQSALDALQAEVSDVQNNALVEAALADIPALPDGNYVIKVSGGAVSFEAA